MPPKRDNIVAYESSKVERTRQVFAFTLPGDRPEPDENEILVTIQEGSGNAAEFRMTPGAFHSFCNNIVAAHGEAIVG